MDQKEIRRLASEAVREAVRRENITHSAAVMDGVPEILDSVTVDMDFLRGCVEEELNRQSGNPINALLGLMGLKIVNTKKTLRELGLDGQEPPVSVERTMAGRMNALLKVDSGALNAAVGRMVGTLAGMERAQAQDKQSERAQSGQLHTRLDGLEKDYAQLSADYQGQRSAVLERVQYMLALCGPDAGEEPMVRQLQEMLEDLEVQAWWSAVDAPYAESAMFTTLKWDGAVRRRLKPCLTGAEGVILKGVRFVSE